MELMILVIFMTKIKEHVEKTRDQNMMLHLEVCTVAKMFNTMSTLNKSSS